MLKSIFVALFLLALVFIGMNGPQAMRSGSIKASIKELVNLDTLIGIKNYSLLQLGISGEPDNVIVGKNGFLFLGQNYSNSLSQYLGYVNPEIGQSQRYIQQLQTIQVRAGIPIIFQVAPAKASIYPEFLPVLLQVKKPFINTVEILNVADISFTPKSKILELKRQGYDTYWKGDTHWNELGGYVAYIQLMNVLNETFGMQFNAIKGLDYRSAPDLKFRDLDLFLKLNSSIISKKRLFPNDFSNAVEREDILGKQTINIQAYNPITYLPEGNPKQSKNKNISTSSKTYAVQNKHALNQKKVVWLRDSFGDAMSKPIFSTFEKVIAVHPRNLDAKKLKILMSGMKPDVIIITLTERHAFDYLQKIVAMLDKQVL